VNVQSVDLFLDLFLVDLFLGHEKRNLAGECADKNEEEGVDRRGSAVWRKWAAGSRPRPFSFAYQDREPLVICPPDWITRSSQK
jgi:hypothetical protein